MIYINLKGGAGNQVFQLSKVATCKSSKEKIIVNIAALNRSETQRNLFRDAIPNNWSVLIINSNFMRLLSLFCTRLFKREFINFLNIKILNGYFQNQLNKQYFNWLFDTLIVDIPKVDLVIHTRGGDYLSSLYSDIYLNITGQENIISKDILSQSKSKVVIGNHHREISRLVSKGFYFYEHSIIDDLIIAANSKQFISSNSTFSFLAAYFALRKSADVYVPSRYYSNDRVDNPFDLLIGMGARKYDVE